MNELTNPIHYCSENIFLKEIELLKTLPKLVAHQCEFSLPAIKLIGLDQKSFFMKKDSKNQLSCFLNTCPHRWATLVEESSQTNQDLICKYHGLNFSKASCENKLIKENIFQIGGLVFINGLYILNNLENNLVEKALLISNNFKNYVGHVKLKINANWKIIVENTLESVHVRYVHPNFPKVDTKDLNFEYYKDGSSSWSPRILEESPLGKIFTTDPATYGKYSIIHFFPLSFISTVNGISSSLVRLNPLKYNETEMYIDIYTQDFKTDKIKTVVENQIYEATKKIFEEDKQVCELAQQGTTNLYYNNSQIRMDLWPSESRIQNFHRFYLENIKKIIE